MGCRAIRVAATIAALCIAGRSSRAQSPVMLEGILDGELWNTDTSSNLISRNDGNPAPLVRLQMWGAIEPMRGLVVYGLATGERGSASTEEHVELEQAGVRAATSQKLVIDAGKITNPVGGFATRRFSTRNPLIGVPDGYPVQYPYGIQVGGNVRWLDYRVAVVSLPTVHEDYTPRPDHAVRPVIGGGITPFVGVRLGASYTVGPYLNDEITASQLAQRDWRSYKQRVGATELAVSVGYFELFAETGYSSYDVPNRAEPLDGFTYYAEGKYTFTPRFFVATRWQRNDYPFIRPVSPTVWVARKTDFHDEEFGIGFRVTAGTLLKASYRQDTWHVDSSNQAFVRPGGTGVALQLSQSFDIISWYEGLRR